MTIASRSEPGSTGSADAAKPPMAAVTGTKIVFVTTSSLSLRFYQGVDELLRSRGFEVVFASGDGRELDEASPRGFQSRRIDLTREVSPWRDLSAFLSLLRWFWELKLDIVVAGTPKAGLLGTIAGRIARVPHVVLLLHGLRSETLKGWRRLLISCFEKLSAAAAHQVVCVSPSVRRLAIGRGIVPGHKSVLIGAGSANGVDVARFRPTAEGICLAAALRERLGVPKKNFVIGFIGRLVNDKGIRELVDAFLQVYKQDSNLTLLLIGGYEDGDPVPQAVRETIERHPAILLQDFVEPIDPWYRLLDMLVLPTYREGLPTVLLEAQAAGVPVVTTRVTGAVDAVLEGETALVVKVRDAAALASAMGCLLRDPQRRQRMAEAGRIFVQARFSRQDVISRMADFYAGLLAPDRGQKT